jgi:CBS domain containing-hemolysin-like protein
MGDRYLSYRFLLLILILGLNAFFAASEVALLSVRRSLLRVLAEHGSRGAQSALNLLNRPERLLSVSQVGVTLASLGLGWAGEDTVFRLLVKLGGAAITPHNARVFHAAAFVLAFLVIGFAHVVIGEVVPKNLAVEKAARLAVVAAPALVFFYRLAAPFIIVVERSAAALSKALGLRGAHRGGGHSAEELKWIIRSGAGEGNFSQFEQDAIGRILELENITVREVMVPRNDIVSLPVDATLDEVAHTFSESQYSRLPVYQERPEQIIGILHYKDVMRHIETIRSAARRNRPAPEFHLRWLLRKHLVVPETKPLVELIDEFRKGHHHMAMVVDEFGTIVGLATLEDVLEQIIGEIEDEHDARRALPPLEARVIELEGATSILDLEAQYGIELPADAGFQTLAGFLLFQFGHIPQAGETVEHQGRRFIVLRMEGNRIAQVRIEKAAGA